MRSNQVHDLVQYLLSNSSSMLTFGLKINLNKEMKHTGSSTCYECKKPLETVDGTITVSTNSWHEACFSCSNCRKLLAQDKKEETIPCRLKPDGKILCLNCFDDYEKETAILCTACNKPMKGTYLEITDEKKYHPECFKCSSCGDGLSDEIFENESGGYLCEKCVIKCSKCNKAILGEFVDMEEGMAKKFHYECFGCHFCGKELADEVFNIDNNPACEDCASKYS